MSADIKGLNIVFMGSPDFACPTLQALIDSPHNICHVMTQPPRAAGRGMAQRQTPIAALAGAHNIPVSWPDNLKSDEEIDKLAALEADLYVVVAYGLILPKRVLELPALGALNGHASLLPRWRGAAPIQRAIEAGDANTGTCAMMMEEGLDTGPVIIKSVTDITADDTAQTLHDRLAKMTATTLIEAIGLIAQDTAQPISQPEEGITYAAKIQKAEAALNLARPALDLKNQIHALSPFPGAFIIGDSGKRLKCLQALIVDKTHQEQAGTYLGQSDEGALLLACGDGKVLGIQSVQPAGKKPMSAADFLRGKQLISPASLTAQL